MGLDIFFSEDIRNAILAANEASAVTAAVVAEVVMADSVELLPAARLGTCVLRAYREGYKAALITIALAFGLNPQVIVGKEEGL